MGGTRASGSDREPVLSAPVSVIVCLVTTRRCGHFILVSGCLNTRGEGGMAVRTPVEKVWIDLWGSQ
jgi:hypothetical protein